MEYLNEALNFVIHLDRHLYEIVTQYGTWTYAILFVVIFCETGFVVTPFLPGDSLLFAAGALSALGAIDLGLLIILLATAAVAGDTANYWIGHYVGPKVFHEEHSRFWNKEYLYRTHSFYERHGGKTIVIARFLPIIRTFAPFVAGIGSMIYSRFILYNVVGGAGWVIIFLLGGYYFGNIPIVKNNFSLVILAMLIIPGIPAVIEFLRHYLQRKKR
ncbi:MAG: DedA family protein [Bacteroidota bacterium]